MTTQAKFWKVIQQVLPSNRWTDLSDLYPKIERMVRLDDKDRELVSDSTDVRWQRSVRNTLQGHRGAGVEREGRGRYRLKKEPRAKPRGPTRAVRRKTKPLKQEAGKTPHDPRKDDVSIISEEVRVALPGNPTAQELELEAQRLAKDWVDPTGTKDARERTLSLIVRRQGQPAFRRQLIAAYKGRCAITGCEVQAVLEAAHIVPYKGSKTNDPGNGLLLRADMHTLFDLRLVAVDVATMRLLVSPALAGTPYDDYRGKRIMVADDPASQRRRAALEQHRQESGLIH